MNVITNFQRRIEDDYYNILGCHDSASNEQILTEYKHRVLLFHPDKSQDDSSKMKFQKLQEAKEVLTDPDKRKDYDKWKGSGITISYQDWLAMKGSSTPVFHWATHNTEGRMLESSNMKQAQSTFQKHSYSHENEVGDRSHQSHNSLLRKFRNYEI